MSGKLFSNAIGARSPGNKCRVCNCWRAAHEAEAAGQTLYYVQAVDRATGSHELTAEETAGKFESGFDVNHGLLDGNGSIVLGYGSSNFSNFENSTIMS